MADEVKDDNTDTESAIQSVNAMAPEIFEDTAKIVGQNVSTSQGNR